MFRLSLLAASLLIVADSTLAEEKSLPPLATGTVNFDEQVWPLLESKCFDCHGDLTEESQLRLDRKSRMLRGGISGEPAILVGNSADSHLIKLVTGLEVDSLMPPDEDERLTPAEIGLLRAWIDQGANWPGPHGIVTEEKLTTEHWSFQPVRDVVPPQLDDPWIRNEIDAFILRNQRDHQLTHQTTAKRNVLIRRVYLDMLGLPPSPEDVRRFVNDSDPLSYETLVERVLTSSHYGERWARYWLDLVRFAETHGFETNRERPNAWPYRDYVIESFNDDKPYGQFIREQLAGDVHGVPIGTAYLVAGLHDLVKSPDINLTLMQRQNELDDIINTTGTVFLGLTIGCARCHNHKFDPITQRDYYSWQAIFAGVQHGDRSLPKTDQQQLQLANVKRGIAALEEQLAPFALPPATEKSVITNTDPVSALHNIERFEPVETSLIRFTIMATNSGEPCLDELEVFSGDENVALRSKGAKAACSSSLPGYDIHKLEHINDGRYGNGRSWISNEPSGGWVTIELPEPRVIDRIEWARDREGRYRDRLAIEYVIEIARTSKTWKIIAGSANRPPANVATTSSATYRFDSASAEDADRGRAWLKKLQSLKKKKATLSVTPTVYAGTFAQPGPTYRLYRGEPMAKREQVAPDTLQVMGRLNLSRDAPEHERRHALADWIASPDNPFTARVIVNRLWQIHFGRGLVVTPSDFGAAGVPPSHPELLDWLARELVRNDWSLKHIHRLILNSATYRQSSQPIASHVRLDASNETYWRFGPRRLEAEPIRDAVLTVSGALDLRPGGPGFSAFEVERENVRHYHPKTSYGPEDWRRMIYMTKVRQEQDSIFGSFDCPDAASSVAKRSRSTTPLQALSLLNSTFMLQQAQLFSERLKGDAPDDTRRQITRAYALCYSRNPAPDEMEEAETFVRSEGLAAFCRALLNSSEFLFLQ